MKNVILIAPPAAGKGTQADLMKEKFNMAHISTGDLLRAEAAKGTELGNYIGKIQASGGLVDADIVIGLLEKRIQEPDCKNGYILDGYPRTMDQVKMFEEVLVKLGQKIDYVIYLDIDRDEAMRRTLGRISCPNCSAIYNIYNDKLEAGSPCPKCQTPLTQRSDDNEETFKKRFDTYIENTKPLIDYYKEKGLLHTVNSGISKQYTFEQVAEIIGKE